MKKTEQDRYFSTADEAARRAAGILADHFGKKKDISYKGRVDLVTDVDIASEKAIISLIRDRHPDHDIVTEESDLRQSGSEFRWIVDPLDGTVNYAHDYPFAAVSIALEVAGEIEVGCVYNPMMDEYFHARRGAGAFRNGERIAVSEQDDLDKAFLATGFPYDIRENSYNNLAHFNHMILRSQAIRRDGSAALNMCYTAMGRFDGYWEITIAPWDIAAGILMVREAGGMVTRLDGGALHPSDRQVVTSNGRIHSRLLEELHTVERNIRGDSDI